MIQSTSNTYLFRLGRPAYIRTSLLAWLLLAAFLLFGIISAILGFRLIPTYSHAFTLYLKWQDALLAVCWYITFDTLVGCVLIARFLYALRVVYRREMIVLSEKVLTVRDLSHDYLA